MLDKTASSARVFNCNRFTRQLKIKAQKDEDPEWFFHTPLLNQIIVLKHRLREGEGDAFDDESRMSATKLILPFNPNDLRDGAKYAFLGEQLIEEVLHSEFGIDVQQPNDNTISDLEVLDALDQLPSLDPFLLKETMTRLARKADDSYFTISPNEWNSIRKFVTNEFHPLAEAAFGTSGDVSAKAAQIADRMWEAKDTEFLAPILKMMEISAEAAPEILFSWKGLLYYKYSSAGLQERLGNVLRQIMKIMVVGDMDMRQRDEMNEFRTKVAKQMHRELALALEEIGRYDSIFLTKFVKEKQGRALKELLEQAPAMFAKLGASIGSITHAVSFWEFRFKQGQVTSCDVSDLYTILTDFSMSIEGASSYEQ